jgi:WD40 repeat protein/DNA-binding XRE family transcriptional regulator
MQQEAEQNKLRQERLRRGWTQKELAHKIDASEKTVGRWERGEKQPGLFFQQKLMELLGKDAESLGFLPEKLELPNKDNGMKARADNASWHVDWGEVPSIDGFCGRENEMAEITRWVSEEGCRVVAILGIGGVGKTTLAAKAAREISASFDYVFWRSLQYAPALESVLTDFLHLVSVQPDTIPRDLEGQLTLFSAALREHRCLLILDNVESVLQAGQRAGLYREEHTDYGRLLQRVGESAHRSCLLLTSREKPKEIARLAGNGASPVRSIPLSGIAPVHGPELLRDKGLRGSNAAWRELMRFYAGNPLALKIVSEAIREVFDRDIAAFLREELAVFGEMHELIQQQFRRFSALEQEVMYWLAIESEPSSLHTIQADILRSMPPGMLLDAFDSLRRRSFIELRDGGRFTLQPVIMEYINGEMVERVFQEITAERLALCSSHALIKAQSNDDARSRQIHSILAPVAERLLDTYGQSGSESKLRALLAVLRATMADKQSYAAGNILNLLLYLHCDLRGYDFSHLSVQQAYVRGVALPEVNFACADLSTSVFTETFTSVLCVAVNANGKLLAAGTTTGEVLLRRAAHLTLLHTCLGHADGIRFVAFNPEGSLLASGSEDQTIRIWNTATGECMATLYGHGSFARSLAFNPAGTLLASGSEDQTIRIWDTSVWQCLHILRDHTNWIRSLAFSADGSLLASGGDDLTMRIWDTGTWQCLHVLRGHTSYIRTIAFSPTGTLLASGSEDRTIRLWQAQTGQSLMVLQGHSDRVRAISYRSDGRILASGSDDQTIRLWDCESGQCLKAWPAHTNRIWSIAFFPRGGLLVSASEDETMKYWEIPSGRCLHTLHGYTSLIKSVAFHPDGQMLAEGNEDQAVRLWDTRTLQLLHTLSGHHNRVRAVAFSPDGSLLASASEDETVRLWESETGQCLKILRGHRHLVRAVSFSPDGNLLASASFDQTIRLWESRTGRCLAILDGQGTLVWSVAFSADGKMLASGSEDHLVRLWDSASGQLLMTLNGHTQRVWSVAFHPECALLASSGDDQIIRLWDTQSGAQLQTLHGHSGWVRTIAISADGRLLASGSHDMTIRLWDMRTNTCLRVLSGHGSCVWSVAFSPDSNTLASGSDDGTTRLWDTHTGQLTGILRSERPYEQMNIAGASGLTDAQKTALKTLGAIENEQ